LNSQYKLIVLQKANIKTIDVDGILYIGFNAQQLTLFFQ
jgi:hypothetical protein